jgi:hypothetical protein
MRRACAFFASIAAVETEKQKQKQNSKSKVGKLGEEAKTKTAQCSDSTHDTGCIKGQPSSSSSSSSSSAVSFSSSIVSAYCISIS